MSATFNGIRVFYGSHHRDGARLSLMFQLIWKFGHKILDNLIHSLINKKSRGCMNFKNPSNYVWLMFFIAPILCLFIILVSVIKSFYFTMLYFTILTAPLALRRFLLPALKHKILNQRRQKKKTIIAEDPEQGRCSTGSKRD